MKIHLATDHAGLELKEKIKLHLTELGHEVIDHGADIVFGHGPHVTRAMEIYKDRLICYSLGNFCTYRNRYWINIFALDTFLFCASRLMVYSTSV